jgi:hypothetical protein
MTIPPKYPTRLSLIRNGLLLICLGFTLICFGCGKNPQADATDELTASFEGSPARDDILKANAAFNEGRYKDSLVLLHKVASRADLTERQRAAMGGIVGQLLKAVHEDPQLSQDVQLHRMMELLVRRTMGEI